MENMVLTLVKVVFVVYLAVYSEAVNVTIFSQKDFNGQKCDIILPGCKPVCSKLVGNVVSLKAPKGTCLKFFASVDCKGTPSTYRGAYTVDAEEMPDLKGTPASEWKAIGDCSQPIGIPDNSVGLFPDKKFKGAPCVVQVAGCKPMCENVAAKSKSLITNVGCCKFYGTKDCTGTKIWDIRPGEKGFAFDEYYGFCANFSKISSVKSC